MGSHIEMEIISEGMVKPSSPTPDILREHKLSFIDQIIEPGYYIPAIFFYENPSSSIDHLKQSLSEALTKFYTLAGRINGNTSVICDDSGALFVEARARAHLSKALHNCVLEYLNQYLVIDPYSDGGCSYDRRNVPLVVKISFFDCGGMAIGVCLSHKLADLSLLAAFMNAWAAIHRGETEIVQPNLDLGLQYFPPLEDVPQPSLAPCDNVVTKRFVFDKEKIKEIKKLISSEVQNPTRVEAVSTFIWKHLIDIARAKDDAKTIFALFLQVNLRPRICPHQSDTATGGNLAVTVYGLISGEETSIQGLANEVRNCKRKFEHELVKINTPSGSIYYKNLVGEAMELISKPESAVCAVTSWCNFPLYQVDFGRGKPLSVAFVAPPNKNFVNLMDTRSGDGIEAWVAVAEDELGMLPSELHSLENNDLYA